MIARDGGNPILVLGSGLDQYIPVERVKPVSTIGAGDCFDAAFLKDISSGGDLLTAVRNASDYTGKFLAGGSPEAAGQSN